MPTTLARFFESEFVTLQDLAASRRQAMDCARAIALLERELREPWQETRDARLLYEHARRRDAAAVDSAAEAWLAAEPPPHDAERSLFGEYGLYRPRRNAGDYAPRVTPDSLLTHAANLVRTARDDEAAHRVLSAWRRMAPEVGARGECYLASAWQFEISGAQVLLRDSLLGPFGRCAVARVVISAGGPLASFDGFQMPLELLHALAPGPQPDLPALASALSGGAALPQGLRLGSGPVEHDAEGARFLDTALATLACGTAGIEYAPAGATALTVTFSYLSGVCEARTEIALRREGLGAWLVESIHHEPAAASWLGRQGARLDLMPLLRARTEREAGASK